MSTAKAVFITGAAGGIGRALCVAFHEAGYFVIGTDRPGSVCETADAFVPLDLRELLGGDLLLGAVLGRVRQAAAGRSITVLVNNAATQTVGPFEDCGADIWQDTLAVNVIAPVQLIRGMLPDLEAGHGSVINIASIHATLTKPGFSAYATSKAAMVGMTRSLAVELGRRIRVNAICPAAIDTAMLRAGFVGHEAAFGMLEAVHPTGRIGTPQEVARLALLLADPELPFANGGVYPLDGGMSARLHDPV